jgi:hypothetical protein
MIFPGFSVMPGYNIIWTLGGLLLISAIIYLVKKYAVPKEYYGPSVILYSACCHRWRRNLLSPGLPMITWTYVLVSLRAMADYFRHIDQK